MANLSCGIVGLPNVGKSTLFNALTANKAEASNYPFCTINPNVGQVEVIDPRLDVLAKMSKSKKIVYATVQFLDIAGLVKGASKGEGLGNKFLANIRETDAILHVVRCFESPDIAHVSGKIDPIRDIEVVNLELILADLQSAENVISRLNKQARGDKDLKFANDVIIKIRDHLDKNLPVRTLELTLEEKEAIEQYPFLTSKKVIYAANVSDSVLPSMENEYVEQVRKFTEKEGSLLVPMCAKIEEEIAELTREEQLEFLKSLGLQESGLQRLVKITFDLLGLITYLTCGELETKAWTINRGVGAQVAAGKIHTDIQKGFIKAEVIHYDDMVAYEGRVHAREAGKARIEGKDYVVKDGDVILFFHA